MTIRGGADGPYAGRHRRHRGRRGPRRLTGPAGGARRGEPVDITLVNNLNEATSMHWHGLELDSYYDGVTAGAGWDRSRR